MAEHPSVVSIYNSDVSQMHRPNNLQVIDVPAETIDTAWKVFEELEALADSCTMGVAKNVNRNESTTGFKKEIFRPLRCSIYRDSCDSLFSHAPQGIVRDIRPFIGQTASGTAIH